VTPEFRTSFTRDLRRVRDRSLFKRVQETIEEVEAAGSILEIRNLKKLRTEGRYYRIRLGDYRIGLIVEGDTVVFVRLLHRSEIYRYFP
jgi:mRNA interferase RelE/StbE